MHIVLQRGERSTRFCAIVGRVLLSHLFLSRISIAVVCGLLNLIVLEGMILGSQLQREARRRAEPPEVRE